MTPRAAGTTYVVTLQAKPGPDPIHAVRAALKMLLRRFDLRCVNIQELPAGREDAT